MRHRQLFTFGAAESIGRAFNWATLAVLPFLLPPSEYGLVGLIVAAEALLGSVVLVGQDRAILRFHGQQEGIYRNSFVIPAIASLLLLGVSVVCGLAGVNVAGISAWPELVLLALSIGFLTANKLVLSRARADADVKGYLILRAGVAFFKLLFAVVLAAIWPFAISYLWALLGSLVLVTLANTLRKEDRANLMRSRSLDRGTLQRLFFFGWPFVFHVVSGNILVAADRFMLQYFMGEAVVGEYTLAYTVGFGVLFVYGAVGIYLEPQIYKQSDDRVASENLLAHHTFLCLVSGLVVGSLAIAAYDLVAMRSLDAGYLASRPVIPVIIAAYMLHPVYNQGIFRLTSAGKTKVIAVASGIAALMNVGLNFLLIPLMGTMGAALATLVSYAMLAVSTLAGSIVLTNSKWSDIAMPGVVVGSFAVAAVAASLTQVLSAALVFLALAAAVVLLNPSRSAHYLRLVRELVT